MSVDYDFQVLQKTRENILSIVNAADEAALLHIPNGFKNNLLWNAGHVIATHQLLVYALSGATPQVSQEFIDTFRKGTIGKAEYPPETLEFIKLNLSKTVQLAIQDYQNGAFQTYRAYETSYGIKLTSVEEAIAFNNSHEALHLGYMMAMRKR